MGREDIIRMAREAGFEVYGTDVWITDGWWLEELERFAALVAAAERNKLAAWMIERGYATGHGDSIEKLLEELEWQIEERIRNERSACTKVCEEVESRAEELWDKFAYPEDQGMASGARQCATAIRARGNK